MSGGLFFGINIAAGAMMAQQTAMNTTSHNISNANTAGYSRQRAELVTSIPITVNDVSSAGQLGSGVEVARISQYQSNFLDYQFRSEISKLETYEGINEKLEGIEDIFMEPGESGLSALMDDFWSGWQELAKNPDNSSIRTSLKETAVSLTDRIRYLSSQLDDLQADAASELDLGVDYVNSLGAQLADVNSQVMGVSITGNTPNDLYDKRDVLLDSLAEYGNIQVSEITDADGNGTGAFSVVFGTHTLVDSTNALDRIEDTEKEAAVSSLENGSLKALSVFLGNDENDSRTVGHYSAMLDVLAKGVADAVNDKASGGYDQSGNPAVDFFTYAAGAADIVVNPAVDEDVSLISAAAGSDFYPGNGDNALETAGLRTASAFYDSAAGTLTIDSSGNTTLEDFYKNIISGLGVAAREAGNIAENQEVLAEAAETRRESLTGVSLDEEMANLIQFQHAFEASAKVISVMDELLDTVINGLVR